MFSVPVGARYLGRDSSLRAVIPSLSWIGSLANGWADIRRILAVVDRSTTHGRRDYAMLLILATYGLRVGQLCALSSTTLMHRQTTRVRAAKGGRDRFSPRTRPLVKRS